MKEEYRGYSIESVPPYLLKGIKAIGKGSVHLELRGAYTTSSEAKLAIDKFLTSKEKPNGKEPRSS